MNYDTTKKYDHHRPVYRKTRTVTFSPVLIDGKEYICFHCDCGDFICHKCPCRHFYAVVHRPPVASDFSPQCRLTWALWFAEPDKKELTEKLTEMSERVSRYGGVVVAKQDNIHQYVQSSMESTDRVYFDKFHNKLVDINKSSGGSFHVIDYNNNTVLSTTRHTKRKTTNYYMDNMAVYEQTMNLVTSKEEQEIITFGFNAMQQSLLRHKTRVKGTAAGTKLVDQSGILASLPVL